MNDFVFDEPRFQKMSYVFKKFTSRDGLTLAYREYPGGNAENMPLLCLHGITRNSADFHEFALRMRAVRTVYSIDIRGRGESEFDPDYRNYHLRTYAQDIIDWMNHLALPRAIFIGTSMGGLITMTLANLAASRVKAAILNDIGPVVATAGLTRISSYVGSLPQPKIWQDAVNNVKFMFASAWPDLSEETWQKMTGRTYRIDPDGVPMLRSDPLIGKALAEALKEVAGSSPGDPWDLFRAMIPLPTLSIRGEFSDVLDSEILAGMMNIKADLKSVKIRNRGHVPLLDEPDCELAIDEFIASLV